MKSSFARAPRGRALSFLFALAALAAAAAALTPASNAQTRKDGPPVRVTPQPQAAAATPTPTQAQPPLSPRERRALAYAKMLEGQRYFVNVRTGAATVETLRRAQAAFQQAAELEPSLAEAHTALAEIALYFDDFTQAEQRGREAVRLDPDNFGARRTLSRLYTIRSGLAENKVDRAVADKAVAELREIARVRPNDAEAWALLAEFYAATGREKEAIEALRKWATLPASIEGRFYQLVTRGRELSPDAANARLGEILLRGGQTGEAIAAFRRALAIEPDNARYLGLLSEALEAGGSTDQSVVDELKRVVAQQPQNVNAVQMLARAHVRAGRVEDAVTTLRAAIAAVRPGNDRDKLSLQVQLAETYTDAARYDDAVAVYEELLKSRNIGDSPLGSERDRGFATAVLKSIFGVRKTAEQADQALATVERLRRMLGAGDTTADILKVELLRSLGKRAEALEAARDARKRFPDDVGFLRLEAYTLTDLGRADEAVALVRARLKGDAEDYAEHLFISSLLISAGRGAEAVEAARKALELAPADKPEREMNALIMLSSAQEKAGDVKGSEATLRRLLEKDPDNSTALNNLGYFLTERNERFQEALELIQRAVRAEPTNPSFLDSLGWVYFKLGKLKEAERYLSDAARRNPDSAAIQEHLGDLFQRIGQREKALASWRKALSLSVEAADTERLKAKLSGRTVK